MLIQNIKIAADAMVFSKGGEHLQLLLIKRKNDPFKGMWVEDGYVCVPDGVGLGVVKKADFPVQ